MNFSQFVLFFALILLAISPAIGTALGRWKVARDERKAFEERGRHVGIEVQFYGDGSFKYNLISSPEGKLDPYKIYFRH